MTEYCKCFDTNVTLRNTTKVYKDECTLCFHSVDDGLKVCVSCFNGSCPDHASLHCRKSNHNVVLDLKRLKVKNDTEMSSPPPQKITKLEIKEETEQYTFESSLSCMSCKKQLPHHPIVDSLIASLSAQKQSEIKAWEDEVVECAHTRELVQDVNIDKVGLKCATCDLTENLWLCLVCGNLGCGRKQYGGLGGNGCGLAHFEATGHMCAVKIGTITPEGTADVFCYKCGEERVDPLLGQHLSAFGINISEQEKTVKSLTEMQIEQNMKFDFSMATEDGVEFTRLYGPGLTGLKNLGNTCYLASVMQTLFTIPSISEKYLRFYSSHPEYCSYQQPADCFQCQMGKMAHGLCSGKYSIDTGKEQKGISPSMLKTLIGKDSEEFSSMRQQDAMEYFNHVLELMERKEHPNDPGKIFKFGTRGRVQCKGCDGVKYNTANENSLHLFIPGVDEKSTEASISDCLDHYFNEGDGDWQCSACKTQKDVSRSSAFQTFPDMLVCTMKRFVLGENYVMKKLNVDIEAPYTLDLDKYRAKSAPHGEVILGDSGDDGSSGPVLNENLVNQLLQMGFPENRCRKALYKTGNSDADTAMMWLLEHMEDADIDDPIVVESSSGGGGNNVDESKIANLMDMGFSVAKSKKALKECGNDIERAVTWLFSHMDDPEPTEDDSSSGGAAKPAEVEIDSKPAKYEMFGFISHKGTSTGCGHYVAHLSKEPNGWVLFNDEKVVAVPLDEVDKAKKGAYIYFYKRITEF